MSHLRYAELALHYEEIDKARGRSTTSFTKEAAIRSVDPDDPDDPEP